MLRECQGSNYDIIQKHIKEAMKNFEDHIIVGQEFYTGWKPDWRCTDETREKLVKDGFEVDEWSDTTWVIRW